MVAAAALAACAKEEQSPQGEEPRVQAVAPSPTMDGEVIALLDEELTALVEDALGAGSIKTKSPEIDALFEKLSVTTLERVFPHAGQYEERTRREGLHRFYHIVYDNGESPTKAAQDISCIPGVLEATPVRRIVKRDFDDPRLTQQWNLVNKNSTGADINVKSVWDSYTSGNPDVVVAVVDGGVDLTHEDLRDNVIEGGENGSRNFVKGNYNVTADEHGTHVAGVISAVNNNGKGVSSIAGGDSAAGKGGVRILSCQIFEGDAAASDSRTVQAMKWGADHGALIMQNSWGYYADFNDDGTVSDSELAQYKSWKIDAATKAAIDYFIKYAGCDNNGDQLPDSKMKGGLVFFAAGNENIDFDPICDYEPVIAVGAFGKTGKKASYSNWGDWVDLGAPGGDGSSGIMSTLPANKYGGTSWQGTSMACPHASGVAALLISCFGGEDFTAEQCRGYLLDGAVADYFSSAKPIGGKLDAAGAFALATEDFADLRIVFDNVPTIIKEHQTATGTFTVTCRKGDKVTVRLEEPLEGVSIAETSAEGQYSLTISGPTLGSGSRTIWVEASSESGASSRNSLTFTVLPNNPPTILKALPDIILTDKPYGLNLSVHFTDEDGETLRFETGSLAPFKASIEGSSLTVSRDGYGRGVLTVKAIDTLGASVEASSQVISKNPDSPVDVFPSVVTDYVNIDNDSSVPVPTAIVITAASGRVVFKDEVNVSVYAPAKIDMSSSAPGVYTATVTYGGKTYRKSFSRI